MKRLVELLKEKHSNQKKFAARAKRTANLQLLPLLMKAMQQGVPKSLFPGMLVHALYNKETLAGC